MKVCQHGHRPRCHSKCDGHIRCPQQCLSRRQPRQMSPQLLHSMTTSCWPCIPTRQLLLQGPHKSGLSGCASDAPKSSILDSSLKSACWDTCRVQLTAIVTFHSCMLLMMTIEGDCVSHRLAAASGLPDRGVPW